MWRSLGLCRCCAVFLTLDHSVEHIGFLRAVAAANVYLNNMDWESQGMERFSFIAKHEMAATAAWKRDLGMRSVTSRSDQRLWSKCVSSTSARSETVECTSLHHNAARRMTSPMVFVGNSLSICLL